MANKNQYDHQLIRETYLRTKSIKKTADKIGCSIRTVHTVLEGIERPKGDKKITLYNNKGCTSPYGKLTLSSSQVEFLGLSKEEPFIDIQLDEEQRSITIKKKQ